MGVPTIRGSREIRAVLRRGKRGVGDRVVVYVLPSEGPSRAAFVAPRSVGSAVGRNRARRILREAWRALLPRVGPGRAVVFVARPGIAGARVPQLVEEAEGLLRAVGVIEG